MLELGLANFHKVLALDGWYMGTCYNNYNIIITFLDFLLDSLKIIVCLLDFPDLWNQLG